MKIFLAVFAIPLLVSCGDQTINSDTEIAASISDASHTDTVAAYYARYKGNDSTSISSGTVSKGTLEHGKLIPFEGVNYLYFDTLSYISGRAFLNDKVLAAVVNTYAELENTCPERNFCVMECSNKHGGKIAPHRTHQNGLSVDFMVPLIKDDQPYYELDNLGRAHYLLEFDEEGKYSNDPSVSIDFNLVARHILLLNDQAKKQGLKISKVIIKMELKDELFATEYGKKLKSSGIYIAKHLNPLINSVHDDHYHIDFVVTGRK